MRYHKSYSEKYWNFLYQLDAFLFAIAACYIFSIIVETGFYLDHTARMILGVFNIFVLAVSLIELLIKFVLSIHKNYFFTDEFIDFISTHLLFVVTLYAFYIHVVKLGLPLDPALLITPHVSYIFLFRLALLLNVLIQFKEFNHILLGLKIKPVQLLVIGFAILILLGGLLLILPQSTPNPISMVDSLFMSTSATCVTGLATIQPSTHFTIRGQWILIFLMQVGGLGIMTMSAFMALLLMGNFGIEGRKIMSESIELKSQHHLYSLLKQIMQYTFVCESIGTAILTWRFYPLFHDWNKSFFYGLFHAVAAFCNAGLSLFTDNLARFQQDPVVVLTVAFLIILGGIGFLVVADVGRYVRAEMKSHQIHHLSAQTKVVLSLTALLIIGGTMLIYFTEYNGELSILSFPYKLLNAFFQSVTARTAGFNTIDIGLLNPATILILMVLMIIGGASGSTAGGIKVNTFGILLALLKSTVQGKHKVVLFERAVPQETLHKAIAITFFSALITTFIALLILMHDSFPFVQTLFESISAFGTVGLSMGITAQLSSFAKYVLIILMFLGRVGPVAFVMALAQRKNEKEFIEYPEEDFLVG